MQSWSRAKDPDDIRDLGFDWSPWLTGARTAIVTSTFLFTADALSTIALSNESIAGGITKFRVTGGLAGEVVMITNRVVFDNGEQIDDTNRLRIRSN